MDLKKIVNYITLITFAVILLFIYIWFTTPTVVTVTGQGDVDVSAANATISFSVIGEGNNATDAIGSIKGKITNLKNALKGAGIEESNLIQSQIMVVPASSIVAGVSGFRSTASIGINKVPTAKIDSIIPVLYGNGASLVSSPVIDVSDQTVLEQTALKKAMDDAKKQADSIQRLNGKLFKKSIAVTQTTTPSTTVSATNDTFAGQGTSKITAVVNVSYKMW